MQVRSTPIDGLLVIEPRIFHDDRGYFFESYHVEKYKQLGINNNFIQDNEARSVQNVVRGLHYQLPPFAQAKLVRVIEGSVLDIAVDIREGSATYGQVYALEISAENKLQMFIPRGFAHGYAVLTPTAIFSYKCDAPYSKEHEAGIKLDDPSLNIDWKIDFSKAIISEKDLILPPFGSHSPFKP
jgi:dTDP-4-dehydrorhamnose 3,5-epimerase